MVEQVLFDNQSDTHRLVVVRKTSDTAEWQFIRLKDNKVIETQVVPLHASGPNLAWNADDAGLWCTMAMKAEQKDLKEHA